MKQYVRKTVRSKWIALSGAVLLGTLLFFAAACSKSNDSENDMESVGGPARSQEKAPAIIEQHGDATVSWAVTPSGKVTALVKPDGKDAVSSDVQGALTVTPQGDGDGPQVVPLRAKGDNLTADIGALKADLTEVRYEIGAAGKTLSGVLHLPKGGTAKLLKGAKVAEKSGFDQDKKGPHGGLLQVVGDDLVEVVGNTSSGEVRVYVLNDDLEPVPVGERKMKLGMYGSPAEMITLKASVKGEFFFGKFRHKANPAKITLWCQHHSDVHVVIVHHYPGHVIHIGHGHRPLIFVVNNWHIHGHGHGHGHLHHKHKKHRKHKHHKHRKHKHHKHKHKRHKHRGRSPSITIKF